MVYSREETQCHRGQTEVTPQSRKYSHHRLGVDSFSRILVCGGARPWHFSEKETTGIILSPSNGRANSRALIIHRLSGAPVWWQLCGLRDRCPSDISMSDDMFVSTMWGIARRHVGLRVIPTASPSHWASDGHLSRQSPPQSPQPIHGLSTHEQHSCQTRDPRRHPLSGRF